MKAVRASVMALLLASCAYASAGVPTPAQVRADYRASDVHLLDRHGDPIDSVRINMAVKRTPWVALADVSPALGAALMQAEDQHFMEHSGVDLQALGKAAWENLFRSRPRGASTITMQLAALLDTRLAAPAQGRSLGQKWDQARAAQAIEEGWTKQQILEAYLNLVSFRGELQGVGAASRGLFGKAPSGLNQAESVILASLVRAPGAAPKLVARRACALAKELKSDTDCAAIEWAALSALGRISAADVLTPAPQVAQQLLKGAADARNTTDVRSTADARNMPAASSTLDARSTLDGPLQRFAQTTLRQQLIALRERNVNDGAVVVIDNASGEILAYVGNAGGSEVDGVAALRQAGSTLKPFLYELAIERQLITAASLLDDSPVDIPTPAGLYVPQNYDHDFKGFVSTRTSLASSLNVPAVRTLLLTGLDRFHGRLRDVGLSSLTESADYYGYSLALGSAEVSLLELANAYRTLANGGMFSVATLRPRAGVGASARPSASARVPARRVLDARASFIIGDILADRAARSLTFGLRNELATTFWSAVKTGTSKDMRDNWCMGYSEKYTVGVWVGNFDGRPMWDVSGVSGAAPVWRDVMDYLHQHTASHAPLVPAGVVRQQMVYEPAIEAPRAEWFVKGTESAVVALVPPNERTPRILYPGQSSIIALDPDIPVAIERVSFQAQAGQGLTWQLDGAALAPANASYAWRPVAGDHALALVDANAKVVALTRFQVRGEAR